jgi:hypothetical protein
VPIPVASASSTFKGARVPIATAYPNGSAYVNFTNIPQGYQDLQIVAYVRSNWGAGTDTFQMQWSTYVPGNGQYSSTNLTANQTTIAYTTRNTNQDIFYCGDIAGSATGANNFNTFTPVIIDIFNYANSTYNKSFMSRAGYALGLTQTNTPLLQIQQVIGTRRNSAPISFISVFPNNGPQTFAVGSVISLYGIRSVGQ